MASTIQSEQNLDSRGGIKTIVDYGDGTVAKQVEVMGGAGAGGALITTVTASVVAVSATSAQALAANANPKNATFVNNGAADGYFAPLIFGGSCGTRNCFKSQRRRL
jgi:hypothetical protein